MIVRCFMVHGLKSTIRYKLGSANPRCQLKGYLPISTTLANNCSIPHADNYT